MPTATMSPLALLLLSLLAVSCAANDCGSSGQADIFFLLDASTSVGEDNFKVMLNFLRAMVNSFRIGPNDVQIGFMTFSNYLRNVNTMRKHPDAASLLKAIDSVTYTKGSTYIHSALRSARRSLFQESNGGRASAPDYLVLLTDGKSSFPSFTADEARLFAGTNITVLSIGIGTNVDLAELTLIASKPSLVFNVSDFQALGAIQTELVKDICEGVSCGTIQLRVLCVNVVLKDMSMKNVSQKVAMYKRTRQVFTQSPGERQIKEHREVDMCRHDTTVCCRFIVYV
ncbi:collagen alpha-1(XII) chain-like [Elysia marginata]|uniref:Collagen alpha-1(XII) chain-like n=1 Tax=Elysia marginata TaxID=1093978 RepID=A0AAV4GXR3_9GAST|nr:collagen alpha-1(XII) chain-like [Elysia marginata]